jgi:hypothetical protein
MPHPALKNWATLASLLVPWMLVGCSAPAASTQAPGASAASGFASATPSAAPSTPIHDLTGHIAYSRTRGQDEHVVYIANADGTDEQQLTLPVNSGIVGLSPDGNQVLVFTADAPNSATGAAATVAVDGSGYAVLPISDPTLNYIPQIWSPDGARVAFEGWDASDPTRNGIYTARVSDGGDIVRVTSHEGPHDIPAAYSPDGTQMVFFRAAVEEPGPWDLGGALWLVNVDGSDARRIVTPGVMPGPGARWSPDGIKILFSTARAQIDGALWTVDADGSNLTKAFQDHDPRYANGRYATGPVWSPDGSQIMFTLNPIADWFEHPANGIYVINSDGTGLALVIGTPDFKGMAAWWP